MFGIIWTTIISIGAIISGGKIVSGNKDSLKRSIRYDLDRIDDGHIPHKTYYKQKLDGRIIEVRYDNGHQVHTYRQNGDLIQKDMVTGEIWNISEEERFNKYNEQKNKTNRKAIKYKNDYEYIYKKDKYNPAFDKKIILGDAYRDTKTGEIYVTRRLNIFSKHPTSKDSCCIMDFEQSIKECIEVLEFYMNTHGMLVCLSDKQIDKINSEHSKKYNLKYPTQEEINRYINFVNTEQKNGGVYFNTDHFSTEKHIFDINNKFDWMKYFLCYYNS